MAAVSEPFKESYHRLKKYDIMEDRRKTNYKKSQWFYLNYFLFQFDDLAMILEHGKKPLKKSIFSKVILC
ncbi:hypothetical protein, partial [Streptococcus pneumoniae]|uniref:hypothetical protein n=1 Tax=Streptococcus pneumoniae TaxID=1313 RepID=UPI001F3E900E